MPINVYSQKCALNRNSSRWEHKLGPEDQVDSRVLSSRPAETHLLPVSSRSQSQTGLSYTQKGQGLIPLEAQMHHGRHAIWPIPQEIQNNIASSTYVP